MSKGMDVKFRQFSYEMETVNLGIKKMLNMGFCLEMRYLKIQSKSNSLSVYKQLSNFQDLTRTIEVCNFQTIHGAPVYIDAIYV